MVEKENYKIGVSVGELWALMHPIRAVLDTGTSPNLLYGRLARSEWWNIVNSQSRPPITEALRNKMNLIVQIILSTQVGGLYARIA